MYLSHFQKLISYLHPVRVWKGSSEMNPVLELFFYKGQWQLATEDAIYSDGDRYRPLRLAFDKVKEQLPQIKNAAVLGTGLGSAVTILDKMGFHPLTDLVEIDPVVLKWAQELLPDNLLRISNFICADAAAFMRTNQKKYDLIVVDIFEGRIVPEFVMKEMFLKQCKNSLNTEGTAVVNYIVRNKDEWDKSWEIFKTIFESSKVYDLGVNRVLVGENI